MTWTEKEDDQGLPRVLKTILAKQRKALAEAADRALRFGLSGPQDPAVGLMAFLSDAEEAGLPFAAAKGVSDAFAKAKGIVAKERHSCCEPGEVFPVPGTAAAAYVLGPPRSDERLRQVNPTRKGRETYVGETTQPDKKGSSTPGAEARRLAGVPGLAGNAAFSLQRMAEGRSSLNAFAMPLLGSPVLKLAAAEIDPEEEEEAGGPVAERSVDERLTEKDTFDLSFPFDASVRIPLPFVEAAAARRAIPIPLPAELALERGQIPFPTARSARHEGANVAIRVPLPLRQAAPTSWDGLPAAHPGFASYFDETNHWRRIDFDWLGAAEAFALQADTLTNNTSLVLAFELPPARPDAARKVLLFVGDAQVGNWLSWDEIEGGWKPRDGAQPSQKTPDIGDLLRRVAFYKVGHHGSHNATLKAKGVERMPAGEMTAFVPVSVEVARELKDWCEMPLDVMLDALSLRARGQVLLPNAKLWPSGEAVPEEEAGSAHRFARSAETLPAKVRKGDGSSERVEDEVPLWVQTAIDY
jgi:hypothetical protein